MAVPTIDAAQSVLGFRAYETIAFQPGGFGSPGILYWTATSLPSGLSIDTPAQKALTGVAATDVLTSAAHGYLDGDAVYMPSLTGGAGLSANTIYYIRDKTTDTFKFAASAGGPAIDVTTDLSAGFVRKVSSGAITGSVSTGGVYVVGLRAHNADGASAVAYFTFGILAADGTTITEGGSDTAIDLAFDLITRTVTLIGGAATAGQLFSAKQNDTILLGLIFTKGAVRIDPSATGLQITFKKRETEGVLVTSSTFDKVGSGATALYRISAAFTGDDLAGALSESEKPSGTFFDSLAEIELKKNTSFNSTTLAEVITSKTFRVGIERDLDQAA